MKQHFRAMSVAAVVVLATVGVAIASSAGLGRTAPAVAVAQKAEKPAAVDSSGTYAIDPVHSSIAFTIGHLGISLVNGRFTSHKGTIAFDQKDVTKSTVAFTAETASINTGVEKRDDHLKSADFFDVAKYPELTFKSTGIKKSGKGYVLNGTLTIRGISKDVSIPFTYSGPVKDPWGGTRIGAHGDVTINRQDYGVSWGHKMESGAMDVANEVHIRLDLEAVKE